MFERSLILTFFLVLIFLTSSAQSQPPDSVLYSKVATQVIDSYNSNITDQSELYNGPQYDLYPPANKGTFYFQDKNYCVPSLICFNDKWHKNVPVLYDVYNDIMISVTGNNLYVLNTEKISDVYLLDHHFIYLTNQSDLLSGFYDLLYDGKSKVLVKRTKTIFDNQVSAQFAEIIYEDKSAIYLKKGDKFYLINSQGDLRDIFADKKKQINQFIHNNKIKFNKDKEGAVARIASYYDQISN